jgi:hypothetical protein
VLWLFCSVAVLCCAVAVLCRALSVLCCGCSVTVLCCAMAVLCCSCGSSVLCSVCSVLCCDCSVLWLFSAMLWLFCAVAVLWLLCALLWLFCTAAVLITLPSLTLNSPQICTDHAPCSAEHTATSVGVILSSYNLFATLRQTLRHLKLPQRYCWCLKSSDHHLVLKMKAFWTFETSNTAVRVTGRHLAENWPVQDIFL